MKWSKREFFNMFESRLINEDSNFGFDYDSYRNQFEVQVQRKCLEENSSKTLHVYYNESEKNIVCSLFETKYDSDLFFGHRKRTHVFLIDKNSSKIDEELNNLIFLFEDRSADLSVLTSASDRFLKWDAPVYPDYLDGFEGCENFRLTEEDFCENFDSNLF